MRPGEQTIITVAELVGAAEDPRTGRLCRTRALDALAQLHPPETLLGGAVEREHLTRLYSRRLKRRSEIRSFPAGTEELVDQLIAGDVNDPVIVATKEADRLTAYFFLSSDLGWLIGCVVASR